MSTKTLAAQVLLLALLALSPSGSWAEDEPAKKMVQIKVSAKEDTAADRILARAKATHRICGRLLGWEGAQALRGEPRRTLARQIQGLIVNEVWTPGRRLRLEASYDQIKAQDLVIAALPPLPLKEVRLTLSAAHSGSKAPKHAATMSAILTLHLRRRGVKVVTDPKAPALTIGVEFGAKKLAGGKATALTCRGTISLAQPKLSLTLESDFQRTEPEDAAGAKLHEPVFLSRKKAKAAREPYARKAAEALGYTLVQALRKQP